MKPEIEVTLIAIQAKWKWNKTAQITREIEFQPLAAEVIVRFGKWLPLNPLPRIDTPGTQLPFNITQVEDFKFYVWI